MVSSPAPVKPAAAAYCRACAGVICGILPPPSEDAQGARHAAVVAALRQIVQQRPRYRRTRRGVVVVRKRVDMLYRDSLGSTGAHVGTGRAGKAEGLHVLIARHVPTSN